MNFDQASSYHRYIIVSVLVYLIALFALGSIPLLQIGIAVGAWIANVYFGYKLACALGKSGALWAVLGVVGPLLMWIPHLLLLNSANKAFKQNGMKIGFLGGASKV